MREQYRLAIDNLLAESNSEPEGAGDHDAGGGATFPLAPDVVGWSTFGGLGDCYRYLLTRTWDDSKPSCMFVMMNPSTARTACDDRTVAKVTRMVRRAAWSTSKVVDHYGQPEIVFTRLPPFGSLVVCNTFAYRATDQLELLRVHDPIGPHNDAHILEAARAASMVVFAYGRPKSKALQQRGPAVARMLMDEGIQPHALRLSRDGVPWHPLYLPDHTAPHPWLLGPWSGDHVS